MIADDRFAVFVGHDTNLDGWSVVGVDLGEFFGELGDLAFVLVALETADHVVGRVCGVDRPSIDAHSSSNSLKNAGRVVALMV